MKKTLIKISFVFIAGVALLSVGAPITNAAVETGWPAGKANICKNPTDGFIDFEEGTDGATILSTVPGLKFTTTYGIDWRYGDIQTGKYNVYPYGHQGYETNGNFFAWLGVTGDTGRIDFTTGTATYLSVLTSTYSGLTLDAYDASGNLLATSGWATNNLRTRTFTRLTVEAPGMAYVIVHDWGNYWLIDDLCTDAPGVPSPVNQPPVADANGPYVGDEGSPIVFDGSGSYDPDGTILLYEWDLDGDGQYDDAIGVNPTFTWGDDYTGTIGLKVTDNDGLTDTDSTTITVNNVAPIVEAGPEQEVFAGDTVNFSGFFTDPGWLDTHTAIWDFGDTTSAAGIVNEENNPPDSTGTITGNHIYYEKGTYTVTLTVTDDDGGVGTDILTVVVKPIPATIDCDPDTLNLKSNGEWITCYIELPAGYDIKKIDGSTILLNGMVPAYLGKEGWAKAEANESNIMDHDGDGILERMIKFDGAAVQKTLTVGEKVELIITGKVFYNQGLADFEGSDTIRVIDKGKK